MFGTNSGGANYVTDESGWVFAGWSPSWAVTVTDSVTYVAQWIQDIVMMHAFRVTYNGNGASGGDVPADNNFYDYGEQVVVVANTGNLVRSGYTFIGWTHSYYATVADFAIVGNSVTPNSFKIYDDTVLYALWTQDVYTVSYQPGAHGTFTAQVTSDLHYGDQTPVAPTISSDTEWEFTGWSPVLTATVTGNTTYIAQWTQKSVFSSPSPFPTTSAHPALTATASPSPPSSTLTSHPLTTLTFTPPEHADSSYDNDYGNPLPIALILSTTTIVAVLATAVGSVLDLLGIYK